MSLRIAARLAARELRGGLGGFRILLACLALGVAAIAGVGSTRAAIEAGLTEQGAVLLGGDAQAEFTYRFADAAERAWLESVSTEVSEVADFRSLATVGDGTGADRALTQVKAVDSAYPLLGTVALDPPMPLSEALAGDGTLPGAVMARVLADRLALSPGGTFRLGDQSFTLSAILDREPDNAGSGFAFGPRTIVRRADLSASGLLAPGTLFSSHYRMTLPPGTDLSALEAEAKDRFADTGLRWQDARAGAPGVERFVDRLGAFLILVGLSGLAVGGVGVSSAVRAYIGAKTGVIATLRTLGATRRVVFLTYFLQIGALCAFGIVIGLVLGAVAPIALAPLIEAQLPVPVSFRIFPAPLAEAAVYGTLTALIFTLWPLARTEEVRAATLFRDALSGARSLPAPRYLVATLALTALLLGLAALFTGALTLTLWTGGGILFALGLLTLAGLGVRALARRSSRIARGRPALRWALAAIGGPRDGALSVVLSLGLGLSVLAAVGQIDGNLRAAIARDLPDVAPSYFFVDIQKDQMPGFMARLDDDPAVSRVDSAPMLRGVITRINGQDAQEVAGGHWVVRGDRGLTYSAAIPDRTTLTQGEWWPEDYSGPPLISFAAEEAEEMGLALGDTLTVNVLGRDITGTIASFREVDFSTAGIGFVMSMNPSALEAAPHSFIATVYAGEAAEAAILRDLAGQFPNITAIRVRDAIDQVAELMEGIAGATRWGAAATLLTGFLVLIGAAAAGEPARVYEAAVLKTLGAARSRILRSFALRSALLGAAAGLVALVAGIAGAWAIMTFVMEGSFAVIWPNALAVVTGGVVATLAAGLAFAWRPLAARPARVLRARE
ncbi:ABC transporter permease [Mesobacterium pallidum]|uniref:ABC transporter permease n=1 Tax=Mesobacterium pallidum TaxID=2872037 RepID=UPI001EE33F44|nr:FtsX-like permease family protein [Mesobacterium pallidum]